jgi:SUKH-4 immunity protein
MNATDFLSRWSSLIMEHQAKAEAAGVPNVADDLRLITAPRTILSDSTFPEAAARFLVEAGLPRSCAPFLTFDAVARGPLPLVQFYGAHQFRPPDVSRLATFYVLGSDGVGNPLCLDSARGGEVVMLDHEDGFRTRTFVSSSVATLAEALLIVESFPYTDFVQHLHSCDPPAANKAAFLPAQVAMLSL